MHKSYKLWLEMNKPKIFCQCKCNQEIIIKTQHKFHGIPKYILGHNPPWNKCKIGVYSQETLDKMSKARINKYCGKNHPMYGKHHTQEANDKNRDAHLGMPSKLKGIKLSENHKQKLSKNHADFSGKNNPSYGKPRYHTKRFNYNSPYQGKICFRSSYELKYAQYLDKNNKDWLYEPQTLDLGNITYTPDFYLIKEDKFIEIKGFMYKKSQEKINKFKELYSNINYEILYKEDLIKLGINI